MMNQIDTSNAIFNFQGNELSLRGKKLQEIANTDKTDIKQNQLQKAAQDFESVLITQFLEILNSTVEKSEDFSGGKGEEMFRSMLNQEIAKNISSSPKTSFGFAKQIYEQMKDKV